MEAVFKDLLLLFFLGGGHLVAFEKMLVFLDFSFRDPCFSTGEP